MQTKWTKMQNKQIIQKTLQIQKNAIRNLLIIWLIIGILVNYYELKKYIKKLNIRREDIDYNMSLKEHIFK